MLKTDEQIFEIDARDYLPVFARYKIVLDHGEGVYVYDVATGKVSQGVKIAKGYYFDQIRIVEE